jgi:hypothetical protein
MQGGRVAVLEPKPPEVRVFDADGRHQFTFGRLGQGPGEFSQVQRLVPHAGDSLVVSQIARVSVFDQNGKHARTMSTADASIGLSIFYRMFADGSMLASSRPIPTPRDRPEGIVRDTSRTLVLAANATTILRDFGTRQGGETIVAHFGRGFATRARPFGAADLLEAGDTFIFCVSGESSRLAVLDVRSGRLVREARIELAPRVVTTRDRGEWERQLRAQSRDPQIRDAFLRVMTYPTQMPYFDALRWSYDRVVRLRRYVAPLDSTAQWLSLTPTGQLLSVIDIPAKARVLDFDRDRVLIVERDADDLEYLSLYKLIPSKR